jgi:hypothetical protein
MVILACCLMIACRPLDGAGAGHGEQRLLRQ